MTEMQHSEFGRDPYSSLSIETLKVPARLSVLAGIVPENGGPCAAVRKGLTILQFGETLKLHAPAVIFDIDDTLIKGSGEHLHDGPNGRFARALVMLLEAYGRKFNLADWPNYRALTGKTESLVCQDICRLASREYGGNLDPVVYRSLARQIVLDDPESFTASLRPVDGVKALLNNLKAAGSSLVTCSCGDHLVMNAVMRQFKLKHLFEWVRGSADKRTSTGFSGATVAEVAHYMKRACRSCVMVGDSMSDVGAATRAGLPLVVVRLPDWSEAAVQKFQADYEMFKARYPRAAARTSVVLIQDYGQISAVATCSLPVPFVESAVSAQPPGAERQAA